MWNVFTREGSMGFFVYFAEKERYKNIVKYYENVKIKHCDGIRELWNSYASINEMEFEKFHGLCGGMCMI